MITWLASFPRSGNTLLRMMLFAGWGVRSTSLYRDDLRGNERLAELTGHFDTDIEVVKKGRRISTPANAVIKSHEANPYAIRFPKERVIYGVRDGRAALVSLWLYWKQEDKLLDVIAGSKRFGAWSNHVRNWTTREDYVPVIRYEELSHRSEAAIQPLKEAFGPPPGNPWRPLDRRAEIAAADGRTVKPASDWREHWTEEADALFWERHGEVMRLFYPEARPGLAGAQAAS